MLASEREVKLAMQLNKEELIAALERSGYTDNSITGCYFKGFNMDGTFVYAISYQDPNMEFPAAGQVYVKLGRKPLSSEINFYAEF